MLFNFFAQSNLIKSFQIWFLDNNLNSISNTIIHLHFGSIVSIGMNWPQTNSIMVFQKFMFSLDWLIWKCNGDLLANTSFDSVIYLENISDKFSLFWIWKFFQFRSIGNLALAKNKIDSVGYGYLVFYRNHLLIICKGRLCEALITLLTVLRSKYTWILTICLRFDLNIKKWIDLWFDWSCFSCKRRTGLNSNLSFQSQQSPN